MLDLSKAKRIEYRKDKTKVYIFTCNFENCLNELKSERKYLSKHSGYCRRHAHAHLDKPFMSTYNSIKDSVRRTNKKRNRNLEFDLSYEEFLFLTQIGICYYCDRPNIIWRPFLGDGRHRYNLDRKDNTKGYTFDNVVVCCKECNMMKRDWFSAEEFKAIRLFLRKWHNVSKLERDEMIFNLLSIDMKLSFIKNV